MPEVTYENIIDIPQYIKDDLKNYVGAVFDSKERMHYYNVKTGDHIILSKAQYYQIKNTHNK